LRRFFALDLRSLALVRISAALLLLLDLAVRAGDFRAHYTDFGVLPRAELGLYTFRTVWTLHGLASPHPALVALLFGVAALFAIALLLGWRTWLATFGSWLLVANLQYRNPALDFGGDVMLRMLLFWGLFLPLGARWSMDARRDPSRLPRDAWYASIAGAALIVQLLLVYAFSVLNRTGPTWWNGDALFYALHFDQWVSRTGIWLRGHEAALAPMTYAAIWFEALGPLLALVPVANGFFRTLAVLLFLGFHATLGLLFNIGIFPLVFSVAWLGLLPTWFWARVTAKGDGPLLAKPRSRATGSDADVTSARDSSKRGPSPFAEALAAIALAFVLLSNLSTVRQGALAARFPHNWDLPAQLVWIDQLWGLFSPDPPIYDGWYQFMGVQRDGTEVNPFWRGQPVGFEKPAVVTETMNIRWREFFFRLQRDPTDPRWPAFGRWLCRAWNEDHAGPAHLDRAYVYFVEETTVKPAPVRGPIRTLLAQQCEAE
jgi:hypothetical protein